jgi:nucleotide-binding universal stress UspA family protein
MYKTILIPLDGSKRAEAIIPHAEYMAQMCQAKVVFLQVVEPSPFIAGPYDARPLTVDPEDTEARMRQIDRYLTGWVERFEAQGMEAGHLVAQGPVVETIIEAAEREDADLVAMASHGRSGLTRVFYGSVAAGVLQRIDRPLLLIRSQVED